LPKISQKIVCRAESLVQEQQLYLHKVSTKFYLGATAFIGLGAYSYFSGHSQLKAQSAKIAQSKSLFGMKSRQAGITGIALTLAGMGFWRLVN
jgi:hypothetical protein